MESIQSALRSNPHVAVGGLRKGGRVSVQRSVLNAPDRMPILGEAGSRIERRQRLSECAEGEGD